MLSTVNRQNCENLTFKKDYLNVLYFTEFCFCLPSLSVFNLQVNFPPSCSHAFIPMALFAHYWSSFTHFSRQMSVTAKRMHSLTQTLKSSGPSASD